MSRLSRREIRRWRLSVRSAREIGHQQVGLVPSYREMLGLSLRLEQAARLFGLRTATCHAVLEDLVKGGNSRRCRLVRYLPEGAKARKRNATTSVASVSACQLPSESTDF